jgi:crotonobetainyl-CoA:carnitine CoA-transferase CaiB-like acyl-CoA transferase
LARTFGCAIDLKAGEGLQIVSKLIATADILMRNFRPGAAERFGLGEDAVRAIRPDVIYVSISGFGESGPYSSQRAYDPVIQALSAWITGSSATAIPAVLEWFAR